MHSGELGGYYEFALYTLATNTSPPTPSDPLRGPPPPPRCPWKGRLGCCRTSTSFGDAARTPGDGCPYRGIDTSRANQKGQVEIILSLRGPKARGNLLRCCTNLKREPGDCTTGIPFGHHVASLLAMTQKIEPGSSDYGASRTPGDGCPYGSHNKIPRFRRNGGYFR